MSEQSQTASGAGILRLRLAALGDRHLYVLVIVVLVWTLAVGGNRFWSMGNLSSIGFQMPELGLLTLSVALTLISGGINLATVSTANFAGFIMVFLLKLGFVATLPASAAAVYFVVVAIAGMAVGGVLGALNGVLIGYLRVSPILCTLGTMTLLTGVNLLFTKGAAASGLPPPLVGFMTGTIAGIPVPLLVFAAAAALIGFLLSRTRFGITLYMLGSNERATAFSGIDTRRVLMAVYVLSGVLAALAGFVMMCRFNSVNSNFGSSYLLVSILAAVLGGVDPFGGRGRVTSLVVALVLLQSISSMMNLMGWSSHLTLATWGGLLLLGLALARR